MTERDPSELLTLAPHMRGRMCYIIIKGLRDPDHIVRRKEIEVSCDRLLIKMGKMGILKSIKPGVWKLNIPYLRKIAYVVSDNLFDHLSDPEVMFEYKKKQGKYRKNITYQQQREAWNRKDRKAKQARLAYREKIKETELDSMIGDILFPRKEE
jgi:hypothetical protein